MKKNGTAQLSLIDPAESHLLPGWGVLVKGLPCRERPFLFPVEVCLRSQLVASVTEKRPAGQL